MKVKVENYIKKLIKENTGKYPFEFIYDFEGKIIGFITNNYKAYDLDVEIDPKEIEQTLKKMNEDV
jgi:hypothetical protein